MNELIERLQKEISTWGGHLAPIEVLLKDSLDTLLALQTQLAAAEVKAKEWIDVAYEAASQKEELKRELERVERETITKCAAEVQRYMDELSPQTSERHDGAFVCLTRLQKSMLALPSAKTATETE